MEEEVGTDAYSSVYMKRKLKKTFGSSITISEESGCSSIVTLTSTASNILNTFYKEPKTTNTEEEKRKIISTAAKLIKCDIKDIASRKSTSTYPTAEEVSSNDSNVAFVPDSLQLLLRTLFSEKDVDLKVASIGQAIMQSSAPRGIIAPLQLGLGIQTHHQFGSRFLVDTLNSLGFCLSYSEVQSYERNAAMSHGTQIEGVTRDHMIQFVADNVDHNLRTLDGKGTFHGMGIIAGITPQTPRRRPIPRNDVSISDVTSLARINIEFFKCQSSYFDSLTFKMLRHIDIEDNTSKLDMLSLVTWPLLPQRPAWGAMMHAVQKGNYPGKSSIVFLPIIDLDPSDMSCIYSTLQFVSNEAGKYNNTPVLTFDQPLFWKASMIQASESSSSPLKSIVLRVGGFHLEMSFLGCIGHLMGNSGLHETLETVFASNAVGHMMSGKAVQRALRGHFLVDTALHAILLSSIYDITLPMGKEETNNEDSRNEHLNDDSSSRIHCDLVNAVELLEKTLSAEVSMETVLSSDVLDIIQEKLTVTCQGLEGKRTAKLWLQYMHMVKLLRCFVKAERTGQWLLHLKTVHDMLHYFAAAGHNLYTKSSYLYLQKMQELEQEHPEVFHAFVSGNHVLRRSDRFWAGLSTDLVIEQALMRSIKSVGGLTRGRGMSEQQRAVWLLSMPACADINQAMQDATEVNYITNEQHKECSKSRRERDGKDTAMVLDYLVQRNPFDGDDSLRSIETGETDDGRATADDAKRIGEDILNKMEGQKVNEYVFRKCNKAVTLSSIHSERASGDQVEIDPQLLFQRLTMAADSCLEDASSLFKYELSTYPSSLFESSGLLRAAQKATLAEAIWNMNDCSSSLPKGTDVHHILDGGSLLHRIPWDRGL
ncbi:uncharacterized protein [Argopecten irradians]|uniref:uncharacterized protein n=1 Tax=Argopecten irradians TaxID=31199 RepID=UPI003715D50F